jgi:hypothetical protein
MAAADPPDIIPHGGKVARRPGMVTALPGQDRSRQRQARITGHRRLALFMLRRIARQAVDMALSSARPSAVSARR